MEYCNPNKRCNEIKDNDYINQNIDLLSRVFKKMIQKKNIDYFKKKINEITTNMSLDKLNIVIKSLKNINDDKLKEIINNIRQIKCKEKRYVKFYKSYTC